MTETPPIAPRRPSTITMHGHTRTDDYAWFKDPDWQQVMKTPDVLDADIRAYLEAENKFTEAALAPAEALGRVLFEELKGRIKEDDSSVPAPDGVYDYYVRYETGGQHPIFCRGPIGDKERGNEEVLLDGSREAEGEAYFRVGGLRHAPDHGRVAYSLDLNGSERFTIHFRDIAADRVLDDKIPDAKGDLVWANDGRHLYYALIDDNHRPYRVMRHEVGTPTADDVLVYEESDPGFFLGIALSESRRFIVITAHDHTTSEVHLIDTAGADTAPVLVAPRERDVEYDVSHHGDRLLILTNADGAEDFKIVEAPLADPGRANWTDWRAHEAGTLIRSVIAFAGHIVRLERVDGLPRIVVTELASGEEHVIAFDEEAYDLGVSPGFEFDTTTLRFTYSSMTTPQRTYDYDMATRTRTLRKEQEIPSGHDPEAYVTRRLFADSHDGARVPISLLHRADTPIDGTAPCLLYGYGSYGMSMPASFSPNRLSLVDRGFVYAIAHIRGGTERGYGWYTAGKLMNKRNTFEDFIAAGEHLAQAGYTARGNIAIHGGSAGGMLVGAAVNMRPDLFRAVVAEVPFVDVLNTMCDKDLPLTPPEWPEWGNPIEDEAAHDYIRSYSPYDNVASQAYPAILVTAGLTDPRVTYWEPAKWVARLRASKTDDNLVLLRTNMDAGHGGAAGRFDRLEEVGLAYAFVLMAFGLAG
jgi:oligopeptidase B